MNTMFTKPPDIWRIPAYLSYVQPDLTNEMIAEAEGKIGFPLPVEYLDLLRVQNGGYIRYSLNDIDAVHSGIYGIGKNYPSITKFDWDYCDNITFETKGLIPFDGDGHWHLCLDYRKNPTSPAVTFADVECDEEREIAPSFAAYLELLECSIPSDFVIEEVADIDAIVLLLANAVRGTAEPTNTFDHGYPIYRIRSGTAKNPLRVWLSPNEVPRGFIRENDPRYAELRDRLPGTAPRWKELPMKSYFLSASSKIQDAVLDACTKAGLSLRLMQTYFD
jgi:hypothetical protein